MQLPEHVYRTLVEVCEAYPWPTVQDHDHLGEILNAVAYAHRGEGWGLSRKTGGTRVSSPVGEVAEDILQLPDGNHFDVLGGAAQGQPLRPGRATSIGVINLRDRPWVAPVAHTFSWASAPGPTPTPVPTPTPTPQPQPPAPIVCKGECNVTRHDITGVYEVLVELKGQMDQMGRRQEDLALQFVGHLDDIKQRIDAARAEANAKSGCRLRW